MPIYDFICEKCEENKNKDFIFEAKVSISEKTESECPKCKKTTNKQKFASIPFSFGLTAAEKKAGTTKKRFEMGKHMKNERTKRKKESAPNSRDAISNELWTGSEVDRGVIKGPDQAAGIPHTNIE
jgi:putative FmdB family regulatory protein